jgi:predicted ArsR family transcriptional regulator
MSAAQDGARRRQVLDTLRRAGTPLSVNELAERIGVHPNTARFHLDALAADGRVEPTASKSSGPGRPRTAYALRPGMDRSGSRGYRLLAQILLSRLATGGPDAGASATEAGRAWGRFLIEQPAPFQDLSAEQAITRLAALLSDLDFAPELDDRTPDAIRLRHCPFLELAEEYGRLVCGIHLGLMQGAMAELRSPARVSNLEPFAEPDACLARLDREQKEIRS